MSLPVPLTTSWVTPRHARAGLLCRPMRFPRTLCWARLRESGNAAVGSPGSQGRPRHPTGEDRDGQAPEAAFRRIETRAAAEAEVWSMAAANGFVCCRPSRTVSPSLPPCSASGGASGFLLASSPVLAEPLRTSARPRRAMRLIDFCHPYEMRVPVPRAFPAHCRSSRCVDVSWTFFAPRDLTGGEGDFTVAPNRFGGSRASVVGVVFPRRYGSIEPLTSLSPLSLPLAVDAPSCVRWERERAA